MVWKEFSRVKYSVIFISLHWVLYQKTIESWIIGISKSIVGIKKLLEVKQVSALHNKNLLNWSNFILKYLISIWNNKDCLKMEIKIFKEIVKEGISIYLPYCATQVFCILWFFYMIVNDFGNFADKYFSFDPGTKSNRSKPTFKKKL